MHLHTLHVFSSVVTPSALAKSSGKYTILHTLHVFSSVVTRTVRGTGGDATGLHTLHVFSSVVTARQIASQAKPGDLHTLHVFSSVVTAATHTVAITAGYTPLCERPSTRHFRRRGTHCHHARGCLSPLDCSPSRRRSFLFSDSNSEIRCLAARNSSLSTRTLAA